jgi:hypothetical protein
MRTSLLSRIGVVGIALAAVAAFLPTVASAREGAQSVGNGIKCYTGLVLQADGSYKIGRVCYKGV